MKKIQEFSIETEDEIISYAEIRRKIAALTAEIKAKTGENAVIGVYLPTSVDLVIAFLAIYDLGMDYFPIAFDGARPPLKLKDYVTAVKPDIIISHSDIVPLLDMSSVSVNIDLLDTIPEPVEPSRDGGRYVFCNPDPVRYLFSDLQQRLSCQNKSFEKIALLDGIGGKSHILEILTALQTGATLCVPSRDTLASQHKTQAFLQRMNAGVVSVAISDLGFSEDLLSTAELEAFVHQLGDVFSGAKVDIFNRKNKGKRYRVSVELEKKPTANDIQKLELLQTLVKRNLHVSMYPSCFSFEGQSFYLQHPLGNPYKLNNIEESLRRIVVSEIHKIHPGLKLGVEDNFFQLGLTPYQINKLASLLHNYYKEITLSTLKKYASVGRLARFVGSGKFKKLIKPLDKKLLQGSEAKLIWVHALLGNAKEEYEFVRKLWRQSPPGFDAYIISSRALKNPCHMGVSLEEIAADYLKAIREKFSDAPILLAGWSAGGHIIYEMQRQMAPATAPAIFVDTWHFDFFQKSNPEEFAALLLSKFILWLAQIYGLKYPVDGLSIDSLKDLQHPYQVQQVFSKIRELIKSSDIAKAKKAIKRTISVEKMLYAILSYRFEQLKLPVKLIAADPDLKGNPNTSGAWSSCVEEIEHVKDSDHGSLFAFGLMKDRMQHMAQMSDRLIHFFRRKNALAVVQKFSGAVKSYYANEVNSKLSRFKLPDESIEQCYVNLVMLLGDYKLKVPLSDVFRGNAKFSSRVVVQGVAGIGKSTFCQKIAYEWAKEKLWHDRFELLLTVRLRHLNSETFLLERNFGLAKLIKYFCSVEGAEVLSEEVLQVLSNKIVIILDGWDEFIAKNKNSYCIKAIKDLLESKRYHVILTTRPGFELGFKIDQQLQIMGFEYNDAIAMIQENISKKGVSLEVLLELLRASPMLKEYIKTPIIAEMLSYLLMNTVIKDICNFTMTRVFSEIDKLLWERSTVKDRSAISEYDGQRVEVSLTALKELENDNRLLSELLATIAFSMEMSDKLFVDSRELEVIIPENKEIYLAFLKKSGLFHLLDETDGVRQYEFHHRSLQAFYAAKYIVARYDTAEVSQLIATQKYNINFQMVWYFTAGLLSEHANLVQDFFLRLAQDPITIYNRHILTLLIRSINEARCFPHNIDRVENYVTTLVGNWLFHGAENNEPFVVKKIRLELIDQLSYSTYLVNHNQMLFRYLKTLQQSAQLNLYRGVLVSVSHGLDVSAMLELYHLMHQEKFVSEFSVGVFSVVKSIFLSLLQKVELRQLFCVYYYLPVVDLLCEILPQLMYGTFVELKPLLQQFIGFTDEKIFGGESSELTRCDTVNVQLQKLYGCYISRCFRFGCIDEIDLGFESQREGMLADRAGMYDSSRRSVEWGKSGQIVLDDMGVSGIGMSTLNHEFPGSMFPTASGGGTSSTISPCRLGLLETPYFFLDVSRQDTPKDSLFSVFNDSRHGDNLITDCLLDIMLASQRVKSYTVISDSRQSSMLSCVEILRKAENSVGYFYDRKHEAVITLCLLKVGVEELPKAVRDVYLFGLKEIVAEKRLPDSIHAILLLKSMGKLQSTKKKSKKNRYYNACCQNFTLKSLQAWMADVSDKKWLDCFMRNYAYSPDEFLMLMRALFLQKARSENNKIKGLLSCLKDFSSNLFFKVLLTKSLSLLLLDVYGFDELIKMVSILSWRVQRWLRILSAQETKALVSYCISILVRKFDNVNETEVLKWLVQGVHCDEIKIEQLYEQIFLESTNLIYNSTFEPLVRCVPPVHVFSELENIDVLLTFFLSRKCQYPFSMMKEMLEPRDVSCLLSSSSAAQLLQDYSGEDIVELFKSTPIENVIASCLGDTFEYAKRVFDILIVEREVNLQLVDSHLLIHLNGATISLALETRQKNLLEELLSYTSTVDEYSDAALISAHRQMLFGSPTVEHKEVTLSYSSTL